MDPTVEHHNSFIKSVSIRNNIKLAKCRKPLKSCSFCTRKYYNNTKTLKIWAKLTSCTILSSLSQLIDQILSIFWELICTDGLPLEHSHAWHLSALGQKSFIKSSFSYITHLCNFFEEKIIRPGSMNFIYFFNIFS